MEAAKEGHDSRPLPMSKRIIGALQVTRKGHSIVRRAFTATNVGTRDARQEKEGNDKGEDENGAAGPWPHM